MPDVPAVLGAPAAPGVELDFDPAGDALARTKLLACEEAPAPAAPGWVAAPAPELLPAWRHPAMVTVFAESLCCDELVLGVLGVCDGGVDGGCCAPTPTASAALSIVPKMI